MVLPDDEAKPGLEAAYALETPEDNRKLYADWAETYDAEFIVDSRYVYHEHVATIFAQGFSAPDHPVLDVGCGTGVVGEQLRANGVPLVDGIDISPEMLAKAAAKADGDGPIYRELIEADLTGRIDIADDRYAGVVSAGAFTHGHLGPDAIGELLRVGAPGARYTIGVNAAHFEANGFADRFERLAAAGTITGYHVVDAIIYGGADGSDLDQLSRVVVFELG